MSQQEEGKYSYKFSVQAKRSGESQVEQLSKSEVQAYINEVLGLKKTKSPKDEWNSV